MLRAAFAEIDITPPVGTHKIGWIKDIVSDRVADPLFARAAAFECNGTTIGFIQLDLLCIMADQVARVRREIQARTGIDGSGIMVSATHNHAGPAIARLGDVACDVAYTESMIARTVDVFCRAVANLQEAQIGAGSCFEFNVAYNRRVVMRDGTVRTHGRFNDPDSLYLEGPIDPEVFVLAARDKGGKLLGTLVNFACHPTHFGGDGTLSAGYPGVLAGEMKKRGCPVTLFLNGPSGNVHTSCTTTGQGTSMEQAGMALADDATNILAEMKYRDAAALRARSRRLRLPYRRYTEAEAKGAIRGAQRFVDPAAYDRDMPGLMEYIRANGAEPVEVQVLSLDEFDIAGFPAEYFVQFGLRIKQEAHPRHALAVGCTNGIVGYVPTQEAFQHGGYETTFWSWSKLAPEAGDMMANAAIELIRGQ